ncbi:MAG: RagB/SusD family nutrient uptake outer membrane protein [Muribaculaceae bacterium]|nr:RagB/SusD family nutrient uptake outer membrane protein [Muribaculaceae bacterium]
MKTKQYIKYVAIAAIALSMTSCHDWLTEDTPGTNNRSEYFTSINTAENVVNAAYAPLAWEFGGTYYSEWYFGDIVSDDALKGGQSVTDGGDAYDMENFKTNTNNVLVLEFYRAQWQGIARCNLALEEIPKTRIDEESATEVALRSRYMGEAYFLRAYYYFRLLRIYGGMPLIDYVVDSSNKWAQTRATRDETFQFILDDLKKANELLVKKNTMKTDDLGRATKGSAQAMLLKVNLYRAGFLAQEGDAQGATEAYRQAKAWGDSVITSGQYSLDAEFFTNFTLAGENDAESVFEIQYVEDPTSDYGEGEGFTRGTFTLILQRSRSNAFGQAGWGFDKPTQNLYDEFEPTDVRRDLTILNPTDDQIETPAQEIYQGDRYLNRKYAMYTETNGKIYHLTHDSRGPLNNKQIRYSDVLLMYAEACCELGELGAAKAALNQVRARVGLQAFPYSATIQGEAVAFADNQADLRRAIRHERRVELAMEAHRWFDLCRWGIAKETMDAYIAGETSEARADYGTFQKGKHELFPIPSKEIDLTGITQNPGY